MDNKTKNIIFCIFTLTTILISACSAATATSTMTSLPPTETATSQPTVTSSPTSTQTPTPRPVKKFNITGIVHFEHAGFDYPRIDGYKETYRQNMVVMASNDQKVLLALAGGQLGEKIPLQKQLESFLANMSRDIDSFTSTQPIEASIGGKSGLSVDISGNLFGEEITGRVIYILPMENQFFVLFGNAPKDRWLYEGTSLVEIFQTSLLFFSPTALTGTCPISADPTYGYSEENPIHVGNGDPFTGPSLERAYLDKILGPNGEVIIYERNGSLASGELILDAYQLTYANTSTELFLDMYNGEPFRVPVGFSCSP